MLLLGTNSFILIDGGCSSPQDVSSKTGNTKIVKSKNLVEKFTSDFLEISILEAVYNGFCYISIR